jgi:hypothetical protein
MLLSPSIQSPAENPRVFSAQTSKSSRRNVRLRVESERGDDVPREVCDRHSAAALTLKLSKLDRLMSLFFILDEVKEEATFPWPGGSSTSVPERWVFERAVVHGGLPPTGGLG